MSEQASQSSGGPLHPTPAPGSPDEVQPGFSKLDEYAARALQAMIPHTLTISEVQDNDGKTISQLSFPDEQTKNDIAVEAIQWGRAMLRAKAVLGL